MTIAKTIYWITTTLLCLMYLSSAFFYLTQRPEIELGFQHFGYPAYLIDVLIVAKIAAALAILSRISVRLSDLAYAGVFYHLLLALSAHLSTSDGGYPPACIGLAMLVASFFTQNAARRTPSPNARATLGEVRLRIGTEP